MPLSPNDKWVNEGVNHKTDNRYRVCSLDSIDRSFKTHAERLRKLVRERDVREVRAGWYESLFRIGQVIKSKNFKFRIVLS